MPGKVLRTNREVAINAPVLPALTQACASPCLTRLMATRIEESFLARKAWAGDSSMLTNWEACRTTSWGWPLAFSRTRTSDKTVS